jgi:hypothetical protein
MEPMIAGICRISEWRVILETSGTKQGARYSNGLFSGNPVSRHNTLVNTRHWM